MFVFWARTAGWVVIPQVELDKDLDTLNTFLKILANKSAEIRAFFLKLLLLRPVRKQSSLRGGGMESTFGFAS